MSGYLKRFIVGGISLSIVNVSQKIVSFLLLPVFTFYLSPKDFGIIATYSLIMAFLSLFYNPGLISSTERLYYDYEPESNELKKLIGSSWWFLIVVPIIIIIISVFLGAKVTKSVFNEYEFWPYGFLAVVSALMVQPIRLWSSIWVCRNKTKHVALWSILKLITGISVSLILVVKMKYGAVGRIYGLMAGNFLLFLVAFYSIVKFTRFRFSFGTIKHTLFIGLPLIFSVFSYVILDISDRYMIEKIIGLADLGLYDIGYTISSAPLIIMVGFTAVWQPIFYENLKNNTFHNITNLSNLYIMGFVMVCAGIIIFSNEVFNIFINRDYINAIEFIPWIVGGIYLLGISSFLNAILGYEKKFLEIGLISFIAAVINICLNLIFIKVWGIKGAAISTCISYFIYFIILLLRTKKKSIKIFDLKKLVFPNFGLIIIIIAFLFINSMLKEFNILVLGVKTLFLIVVIVLIYKSSYFDKSAKKKFSVIVNKYFPGRKQKLS